MRYRHFPAWFGVVVIGAMTLIGCDDGNPTTSSTSRGAGGSAGAGGSGGNGGEGGQGGGVMATPGAPGHSFVNAGTTIKSPKYQMVFTVGQSSPVQSTLSSPAYKLNGGLIGATSSPK